MVNKCLIVSSILISKIMACAVCYGPIDNPITDGINNAIIFLICVVGFILLSIVGTSIQFYKKANS